MTSFMFHVGTAEERAWMKRGACHGMDPGIFHPDDEEDEAGVAEAKAICGTCSQTTACLDWAMKHRENLGVWGGLSERERRRLRRQRQRADRRNREAS